MGLRFRDLKAPAPSGSPCGRGSAIREVLRRMGPRAFVVGWGRIGNGKSNDDGNGNGKSEIQGSLRYGGKCAAFGRDDGFWGGEKQAMATARLGKGMRSPIVAGSGWAPGRFWWGWEGYRLLPQTIPLPIAGRLRKGGAPDFGWVPESCAASPTLAAMKPSRRWGTRFVSGVEENRQRQLQIQLRVRGSRCRRIE